MQPPAALSRHRETLEAYLQSLLARPQPPQLYAMLRYHLGWEDATGKPAANVGKRLRPALCLLSCEACGGDVRRALPLAAAVELVHNFSLVHDDIQDGDRTRHGRDTVWAVWGEPQAINAGDALLAIAYRALAESVEAGLPPEAAARAAGLLSARTLEMVEGQVMDIEFEQRLDISQDEYIGMIARKTGALFEASLALGALAAGASATTVEAFGRCGRSLGLAFQARDDMLGAWGDETRTGKAAGGDILRRKKSLPVVHTFAAADASQRAELERIYAGPAMSDDDVERILRLMDALGARVYCANVATEHRDAALGELDGAGVALDRLTELKEVAAFLLGRDY